VRERSVAIKRKLETPIVKCVKPAFIKQTQVKVKPISDLQQWQIFTITKLNAKPDVKTVQNSLGPRPRL